MLSEAKIIELEKGREKNKQEKEKLEIKKRIFEDIYNVQKRCKWIYTKEKEIPELECPHRKIAGKLFESGSSINNSLPFRKTDFNLVSNVVRVLSSTRGFEESEENVSNVINILVKSKAFGIIKNCVDRAKFVKES